MTLFAPLIVAAWLSFNPSKASAEVIAIIDTGVDLESLSISDELWTNPHEIAGNGLDDDGNGLVDDIHGWNFSQNNADLSDSVGHGTHVTSIIAKNSKKEQNKNKFMILKYFRSQNSAEENFKNCLKAFRYALNHGATVINFSGGGYGTNAEEQSLLAEAEKKNVLILAAAGNDHLNNDESPFFPASAKFKNILSVGSISFAGAPSRFSNYGPRSVSLFYYGENIESFSLKGMRVRMSGTSQATALLTGELLQLMGEPEFSKQDLADKIKLTAARDQRFHPEELRRFKDSQQTALGIRYQQVLSRRAVLP